MAFINDEIVSKVKNAYNSSFELLKWQLDSNNPESQRHFLSQTYRLILTCKTAVDDNVHSFFVKSPFDSEKYEKYQAGPVIEKEYEIYKNIMPSFQHLSGFDLSLPYPRCYYVHEDKSMILEDLVQNDYKSFRGGRNLDLEHATLALKALAKFHALSVKVDEISPQVFNKIRGMEFLHTKLEVIDKKSLFGNRFIKLISRVDPVFAIRNNDRLLRFKEKFYQTAILEAENQNNGFNVLNHGDFWVSNMMFRYDESGRVENVKFFDFQYSHWASPANDLILFLMMSLDFGTFKKYFHSLLRVYLDELLQTLKILECGRSCTIEQLLRDIRSKYNFWILILIWLGPIIYSTADEFKGDTLAENLIDGKHYRPFSENWMSYFIKESFHGNMWM